MLAVTLTLVTSLGPAFFYITQNYAKIAALEGLKIDRQEALREVSNQLTLLLQTQNYRQAQMDARIAAIEKTLNERTSSVAMIPHLQARVMTVEVDVAVLKHDINGLRALGH